VKVARCTPISAGGAHEYPALMRDGRSAQPIAPILVGQPDVPQERPSFRIQREQVAVRSNAKYFAPIERHAAAQSQCDCLVLWIPVLPSLATGARIEGECVVGCGE